LVANVARNRSTSSTFAVERINADLLFGVARPSRDSTPAAEQPQYSQSPSLHSRDTARAMSQENVEVCQGVMEAFGALRDIEAGLPYLDPEIELRSAIVGGAEGNTYRGHGGIREWMAESDAIWAELRLKTEEFRDLGDQVLIIGHLHARARESGIEIDSPIAWLATVRAGMIVRMQGFLDRRKALEAAGLEECG
jgi:hypothetical protein